MTYRLPSSSNTESRPQPTTITQALWCSVVIVRPLAASKMGGQPRQRTSIRVGEWSVCSLSPGPRPEWCNLGGTNSGLANGRMGHLLSTATAPPTRHELAIFLRIFGISL
jgi:hypothetical protein